MPKRIYLDHAATSAPKPACVAERISRYLLHEGLSAGRGSYQRATNIGRELDEARTRLAELLNAESASNIVWTSGGTEALNIVLQGLLQPGDHVIATRLEHNSVLRPLTELQEKRGVSLSYAEPGKKGCLSAESLAGLIRKETRLICCLHASNVTGAVQPVADICRLAGENNILTLIDAAQTVGHWPVDVREIDCDFLAAPCHKGLRGPLGTGFLYLRPETETMLSPLQFGGTGTQSESARQPTGMPVRFESGSPNVPGLLGVAAALSEVTSDSILEEQNHQRNLVSQCRSGLQEIPGVQVCAPDIPEEEHIGVISFQLAGQDPRIIGSILDEHFQMEVRTGFHCAPLAHEWLGTSEEGGTVRVSFGTITSREDVSAFLDAIRQIASSFP